MNISLAAADAILARTLHVLNDEDRSPPSALDELPAPIYVTDADGVISYYNPACIAFAGRVPALGQDRWCVTWKLYTEDGAFLPHDKCPMADAIELRAVSDTAFRCAGPVHRRRQYADRRDREQTRRGAARASAAVPPSCGLCR